MIGRGLHVLLGLSALFFRVSEQATHCSCVAKTTAWNSGDQYSYASNTYGAAPDGGTIEYDFFSRLDIDATDKCYIEFSVKFNHDKSINEVNYVLADRTHPNDPYYYMEVKFTANEETYVNGQLITEAMFNVQETSTIKAYNEYHVSIRKKGTSFLQVRWYEYDLASKFQAPYLINFQLLTYNGDPPLMINSPTTYPTTGVCGDCNSVQDDFVGPHGLDFTSLEPDPTLVKHMFLESQRISDTPGYCSSTARSQISAYCDDLTNFSGPFDSCLMSQFDTQYFDLSRACSAVVCHLYDSDQTAMNEKICSLYSKLQMKCPYTSVTHSYCDSMCTGNQRYAVLKPVCENSCNNIYGGSLCAHVPPQGSGCVCKSGYYRDDTGLNCVSIDGCGCKDENNIKTSVGESTIKRNTDCKVIRTCTSRAPSSKPMFVETAYTCVANAHCDLDGCICDAGFEDPSDGLVIDIVGQVIMCQALVDCTSFPNTEFSSEHSPCTDTCQNPTASQSCSQPVEPGCNCVQGYITHFGECVQSDTCPCYDAEGVERQQGETFVALGCTAEQSCVHVNGALPTLTNSQYSCATDYSSHSHCDDDLGANVGVCKCNTLYEYQNGACQAMMTCVAPLEYTHNGKSCANTCDEPNAAAGCSDIGPACQCPQGKVQYNDGEVNFCLDVSECTCTDSDGSTRSIGHISPNADCTGGTICESKNGAVAIYPTTETCVPHADCNSGECICYNQGKEYVMNEKGFCDWKYSDCRVDVNYFDWFDNANNNHTDNIFPGLPVGKNVLIDRTVGVDDGCAYKIQVTVDASGQVVLVQHEFDRQTPGEQYSIDINQAKEVTIKRQGVVLNSVTSGANGFVVVTTSSGRVDVKWYVCDLRTFFVGNAAGTQFYVRIEDERKSGLTGLCGNLDGVKDNDFWTPHNTGIDEWNDAQDVFYYVWQSEASVPEGCSVSAQGTLASDCGVYQDENGSLAALLAAAPGLANDVYKACQVAVCLHHDSAPLNKSKSICELHHWLEEGNNVAFGTYHSPHCSSGCGFHASFKTLTSKCPDWCGDASSSASCSQSDGPGCACDPGYLFESPGGECITYDECGCKDSTGYQSQVSTTYLSTHCSTRYTCTSQGPFSVPLLTFESTSCHEHSTCSAASRLCECHTGYHRNADTCVQDVDCSTITGAIYVIDGNCHGGCDDPFSDVTCMSGTCNGLTECNQQRCGCPEGFLVDGDKCTPFNACGCEENGIVYPVGAIWPYAECLDIGKTCIVGEDGSKIIVNTPQECPLNAFGCVSGTCGCLGGYTFNPVTHQCDFQLCQCFHNGEADIFKTFEVASSRIYTVDERPDYRPVLKAGVYILTKFDDPTDACDIEVTGDFNAEGVITKVEWKMNSWIVEANSDLTVKSNGQVVDNPSQYTGGNTFRVTTEQNIVLYMKNGVFELKWFNCRLKNKYDFHKLTVIMFDGSIRPPKGLGGLCGNCDGNLYNDDLGPDGEELTAYSKEIRPHLRLLRNTGDVAGVVEEVAMNHATWSRCSTAGFGGLLASSWGQLHVTKQERLTDYCHATVWAHWNSSSDVLDQKTCEYFLMVVQTIEEETGAVIPYRPHYCQRLCPEHASYSLNAQCQGTCETMNAAASCGADPAISGCLCDDGYVQNGPDCIQQHECGCMLDGNGHGFDKPFLLGENCTQSYSCSVDGVLSVGTAYACSDAIPGSICALEGVESQCVCPPGWELEADPNHPGTDRTHCVAPLVCAANETYSLEAPACVDSCLDPEASNPFFCVDWFSPWLDPLPPAPGCMCLPGYLYKENVGCVLPKDCGCMDEWNLFRQDGEVWKNAACHVEIACVTVVEGLPPVLEYSYNKDCCEAPVCECTMLGDFTAGCTCGAHYNVSANSPGQIGDWDLQCEPAIPCPPGLVYSVTGSRCPNYCGELFRYETCVASDIPTCVCPEDQIFDAKWTYDESRPLYDQGPYPTCVNRLQCGCMDQEDKMVPMGNRWMYGNCDDVLSCTAVNHEPRLVSMETNGCVTGGTCVQNTSAGTGENWMRCDCWEGYDHHLNKFECHIDLGCGEHAHGAYTTEPCSDTCMNPVRSQQCTISSLECVCDLGYYKDLVTDTCVSPAQCPCYDGDRLVEVGISYVAADCSTLITCTAVSGQLPAKVSAPYSCGNNSACSSDVPGTCACLPGYEDNDNNGDCEPKPLCHSSAYFDTHISTCQPTCKNPTDDPTCPLDNGCKCIPGHLFHGEECLEPADCHCVDQGNNYYINDQWPAVAGSCSNGGSKCVRQGGVTSITPITDPCPDHSKCSNGVCTCFDGYSNSATCQWDFAKCQYRYKVGGNSGSRYFRTYDQMYSDRVIGSISACTKTLSRVVDESSTCFFDITGTIRPDGTMEQMNIELNDQTNHVNIVIKHLAGTRTFTLDVDNQINVMNTIDNYMNMGLDLIKASTKWEVKWFPCELRITFSAPGNQYTWTIVRIDALEGQRREPMTGMCGDGMGDLNETVDLTCP